jgi:uncharacterized PurR-regulated membrane protein YhhQ (DUF165 family)
MTARALLAVAAIVAYVAAVLVANLVTSSWGLVPAGFGLLVPAGTYCAGLALALRDAVHRLAGVGWALAAITVGIGLSFVFADPTIAWASAAAFTVSELLDLAVFAKVHRRHGWLPALLASNTVGAPVDTLMFLALSGYGITATAFGGQMLVKLLWVTGSAALLVYLTNRTVTAIRTRRTTAVA